MMYDGMNDLGLATALAPAAAGVANTPYVTTILDCQGKDEVTLALVTGVEADADSTFTVLLEESAASNMAGQNAVADEDLIGTEALASFTFADDGEPRKLGYRGSKRYIRATITPANNAGTDHFLAGLCVFKDGYGKEPNPPV